MSAHAPLHEPSPIAPRLTIDRPDVTQITLDVWPTAGAAQRRLAAQLAADALPPGARARHVHLGTNARTVLQYMQWAGAPVAPTGQATAAVPANAEIATLEHQRLVYVRSLPGDPSPTVGCIVVVRFDVDGIQRQLELIERIVEAAADIPAHPGMLGSHFHRSLDGTQVVNYAEFRDQQAHDEVVAGQLGETSPVLHAIQAVPGVQPLGYERFLPFAATEAPAP
jgi:hypothetical protein